MVWPGGGAGEYVVGVVDDVVWTSSLAGELV